MKSLVVLAAVVGVALATPFRRDTPSTCGYDRCTLPEEGVLNVHIVPHTHDDVGWLKTVDQYYYGSRNNIQKAGVQYIIDSVVKELWEDPARRFIYVETAFFWKWWNKQEDAVKEKVHVLVREGRLQFVGGAWSMNDEAASHYQSTIDQFTWGLRKLNDTFGPCSRPRVGWQIDPFGHAREFASLLAGMAYDGLFLGRIDYQDKRNRLASKTMEMVWRGDDDLGASSDIFTGALYNTYSPPAGFCFDVLCSDEPIIDDVSSPMYNVDKRVADFMAYVTKQSKAFRTNNVILTMGGDFTYQDAMMWYINLDKLIRYTNLAAAKIGTKMKLFYSTPDCYLNAVRISKPTLPTKQDDFFPYASDSTAYWTGYFTSRPTTKWFEREGNDFLQMVKQLQVLGGLEEHNVFVLDELKSAMGIMQHHDAVTGTEKQHVAHDYERILDQAIEDSLIIARQALSKWIVGDAQTPLSFERCQFNQSQCSASESYQQFVITVYNPLAWKLEVTPIRIPVIAGEYSVTAPNGEVIQSQLVELPEAVLQIPTRKSEATHELVFLAYNVKPLGYKNFLVQRSSQNEREIPSIEKSLLKHTKIIQKPNFDTDYKKEDFEMNLEDDGEFYDFYSFISKELLPSNNNEASKETSNLEQMLNSEVFNIHHKQNSNFSNDQSVLYWNDNVGRNEVYMNREETRSSTQNNDVTSMLGDDSTIVVTRTPEDNVLENQSIKLHLNEELTRVSHVTLPDGSDLPFDVQLMYYPGCYGDNTVPASRSSGAYIFRPNATAPYAITPNITGKLIKGDVVDEIQFKTEFATVSLRVYKHEKIRFVENEWVVGSIPVEDGVGKEVVVRYATSIINNGEFYTDSNGRQLLKRRLNQRPQWNLTLEEPIAGNYYPITNRIAIEDGARRMAVVTDRSQGGTSLREGDVELMLHRRLLHDDAFGVGEALNEAIEEKGLNVQGKHRILLTTTADSSAKIDERKRVFEMHLQPLLLISEAQKTDWSKLSNCHGNIKDALPEGVHLLTLEPFSPGKLLLRLENYLERADGKSDAEVDLTTLFETLKLVSLKETALAANVWLEDVENWSWDTEGGFVKSFNDGYGGFGVPEKAVEGRGLKEGSGFMIKLAAKQIRTFIIDYELVK